jgi:hypothetical protein
LVPAAANVDHRFFGGTAYSKFVKGIRVQPCRTSVLIGPLHGVSKFGRLKDGPYPRQKPIGVVALRRPVASDGSNNEAKRLYGGRSVTHAVWRRHAWTARLPP